MPVKRPFLTVAELAPLLGVGKVRTYQLVKANEVPSVRVGGRILIPRAAYEEWLKQKASEALSHASVKTGG